MAVCTYVSKRFLYDLKNACVAFNCVNESANVNQHDNAYVAKTE